MWATTGRGRHGRTSWRRAHLAMIVCLPIVGIAAANVWSLPVRPAAAAEPEGPALEAEDIRILLNAAGLTDFRVLGQAEMASDWPDAAFVWTNEQAISDSDALVVGVLAQYPVGSLSDFDKTVRMVVIDWSKSCTKKSRVALDSRHTLPGGQFVRRASVECPGIGDTFVSRASFFGDAKNVFGFAHFFTNSGRARGEAADRAIYETFMAIVTN